MNICSAERQEKIIESILESKFVAKSNNVFMIISHDFMSYYYDDAKVLESPKYQEWQNDNINNKSCSSSASIFHPDW